MSPFLCLPSPPSLRLFASGEAVFARCLSSLKEERVEASRSLSGPQGVKFSGEKAAFLEDIRKVKCLKRIPRWPDAGQQSFVLKALSSFVSAGSLCIQDHFLRAGFHAAATGGQRVRLVPQLRRHRSDVERRLHHPKVRPQRAPTQHITASLVKHAFSRNFLRKKSHPNLHCSEKGFLLVQFLIFATI